jgi:biotin carboxylase
MKKFLLVEHGGARKQFTLDTIKSKGFELYLACAEVPDWLKKYLPHKNIIITDPYNSVKLLADVVSFMAMSNIEFDAMGTFYEHTVAQTADIARALGLIGLDPGAARRSSVNKLLMRMTCKKFGILTPRYEVIDTISEDILKNAIKKVGTPCVIKPIFGAESYGTVKIEKDTRIKEVINEIQINTTPDKKKVFKNFTGKMLIEEYLSGAVVSVDGIVQNKKIMIAGLVEFIMGPEPRFTQEANYIPARLSKTSEASCKSMAIKIIKALGFDNCGFHCELRVTTNGPVLIEIASSLPGGPLQPGYLHSNGIDLTSLLVDVWLGKKINLKANNKMYVLQKAFFSKEKGIVSEIKGIKKVRKLNNVWDFADIAKVGDKIITYPEIPVPLYYYAIEGKNMNELDKISKYVESTVQYSIKP